MRKVHRHSSDRTWFRLPCCHAISNVAGDRRNIPSRDFQQCHCLLRSGLMFIPRWGFILQGFTSRSYPTGPRTLIVEDCKEPKWQIHFALTRNYAQCVCLGRSWSCSAFSGWNKTCVTFTWERTAWSLYAFEPVRHLVHGLYGNKETNVSCQSRAYKIMTGLPGEDRRCESRDCDTWFRHMQYTSVCARARVPQEDAYTHNAFTTFMHLCFDLWGGGEGIEELRSLRVRVCVCDCATVFGVQICAHTYIQETFVSYMKNACVRAYVCTYSYVLERGRTHTNTYWFCIQAICIPMTMMMLIRWFRFPFLKIMSLISWSACWCHNKHALLSSCCTGLNRIIDSDPLICTSRRKWGTLLKVHAWWGISSQVKTYNSKASQPIFCMSFLNFEGQQSQSDPADTLYLKRRLGCVYLIVRASRHMPKELFCALADSGWNVSCWNLTERTSGDLSVILDQWRSQKQPFCLNVNTPVLITEAWFMTVRNLILEYWTFQSNPCDDDML